MTAPFDPMSELQAAFTKVFQKPNWLVGLPTLIGFAVVAPVMLFFISATLGADVLYQILIGNPAPTSAPPVPDFRTLMSGVAIVFFVALVVIPLSNGWTLAVASSVWAGKGPGFGAAFSLALTRLFPLILFQIVLGVVGAVSIITIIGPFAVAVLGIYGPAYVVLGNTSPFGAVASSFRMAWRNLGSTLLLILATIVVSIVLSIPGWILNFIPHIGWMISFACGLVAQILGAAFVALATVRFYDRLRMAPASSAS